MDPASCACDEAGREERQRLTLDYEGFCSKVKANIGRQLATKELIPEAIRAVRVMVARKKMPRDRAKGTHALKRLAQRTRCQRLHVVDITGHQNVGYILLDGMFTEARDGAEARLLQ